MCNGFHGVINLNLFVLYNKFDILYEARPQNCTYSKHCSTFLGSLIYYLDAHLIIHTFIIFLSFDTHKLLIKYE